MAIDFKHIRAFSYSMEEVDMLLYAGIDEALAVAFLAEFRYLEAAGVKKINIRINSGGGNVQHGYSIVAALLNSKLTIHTYNDGVAGSMAAFIFLCGQRRVMADYANLMLHEPSYPSGYLASENDLSALESFKASLTTLTAKRTGKSEAEVTAAFLVSGVDKWFSPSEALAAGLADEVKKTDKAGIKAAPGSGLDKMQAYYQQIIDGDPQAQAQHSENQSINNPKSMNELQIIASALGLQPSATQAEIVAKANDAAGRIKVLAGELATAQASLQNAQNDLATANEKVKQYEKEKAEIQAARITAMIAEAQKDGRIGTGEDIVQHWTKLATDNFETAEAALKTISPRAKLSSGIGQNPAQPAAAVDTGYKIKSFQERQAELMAKHR
jgi:ATP-dependent protease ClpP protease subunit